MQGKNKYSLVRFTVISLTLLVALVLAGMSYGIWSDAIRLNTTMDIGVVDFNLTETVDYTFPEGGTVVLLVSGDSLDLMVVSADILYDYYSEFSITNTGTLPIKLVMDPILPTGVVADLLNLIGDGIIDPGESEYYQAHVYLQDTTHQGDDLSINIPVVVWNQ